MLMIHFTIFAFIFGLIIGSFLNMVIYRMHAKESFSGRSHCTKCNKLIVWYDNIPVVSYLILSGSCRGCNKPISPYYPAVELAVAILFTLTFVALAPIMEATAIVELVVMWAFISVLVVIFVYDLKWYLILDKVTLPAIVFAFLANLYLGVSWWSLLLAAIIGGGFFLLQFLVSKGRWIGGGDIRLGFLMGMMVGYPMILVALMLAYLIGTAVSLPLVFLGKRGMGDKIPFGTFLALSTVLTLLYGENIFTWYLSFF